MGRQSIFQLPSVAAVAPPSMLDTLQTFLINQRQLILPAPVRAALFKTRFIGHNPISEMVQRLVYAGKDQVYSLVKIPTKTTAVPEVVDMTFIPIDLLQMRNVVPAFHKTLSVIPELNDKIIINITDITKANGEFSDISQFHWRVVRDFLSRSYFASSGNVWISPTLVRYLAKVYSMTIGGQISRFFGLTPLVQMFLQTVFCLFYVGKMVSHDQAVGFVKSQYKGLGLIDPQDVGQVCAFVEDILGHSIPTSLEEVCKVIAAYGHSQLEGEHGPRLTRVVLNMRFATMASEGQISAIALEYPPYFLFLVFLVLSNVKIGLSFSMKQLNLVREGQDVVEQMLKTPFLTSTI